MAETYSTCEGPICPYCGHENSSAGNDYWAEKAGSGEHDCDECETAFHFEVDFTTHYYASKINVDGGVSLTPTHIRLLRRGVNGQYIGLADDMGVRMGEVQALGELERAGYVENAPGPFPPGPPSLTPSIITAKGRAALEEQDG